MPRPWHALGVSIRTARDAQDVQRCVREVGGLPAAVDIGGPEEREGWTLLLAESRDRFAGWAELSAVQTLLYHGLWIESLVASRRVVRVALAHGALNYGAAAGMGEIGMMIPVIDHSLRMALKETGFRSLGQFDWFEAELPVGGERSLDAGTRPSGARRV